MDAWRYGIYLLVFTFDISLVRCAHSFDIECEHEKINSISPRDHVLFSISCMFSTENYFSYETDLDVVHSLRVSRPRYKLSLNTSETVFIKSF